MRKMAEKHFFCRNGNFLQENLERARFLLYNPRKRWPKMILLKYYLHTKFEKANSSFVEKVLKDLEGGNLPRSDDYSLVSLWEKSGQKASK